jgi:hypothetical protein
MQFQGNFFIHGWPKYDDASPPLQVVNRGNEVPGLCGLRENLRGLRWPDELFHKTT